MEYKNGAQVLPAGLLEQLQEYVRGEIIYVPIPDDSHLGWGCRNGTKQMIKKRNGEIYSKYKQGATIDGLASLFNLSHESIRKIIYRERNA
ncbi:MAG: CD3324 family protein [Clostridia bacterium]